MKTMKIKVGTQWFSVLKETTIDANKHFEVEHHDDGGNRVTGLIPWWLVEEIKSKEYKVKAISASI